MYLLKRFTQLGNPTCPTIRHPSQPGLTTSETIETLLQRRSIRKYSDAPVTDAQVDAILQAAFRAPTSSNIQSYTVITVRDPETKQKLSVPTGNQQHIIDCPVFLAFCADLTRLEHVLQERGHTLEDNNLEIGLVSSIDASLIGMSAYLAADSLGIRGVMIGAVRNDAVKIAEILELRNSSIASTACALVIRRKCRNRNPDGAELHRPPREVPAGENRRVR